MASIAPDNQRIKLIISGILFFWSLSVFVPGSYSIDAWNNWNEVSSHNYDDWYGTGFATTWRFFWVLTGNYISLYIFQMVLYWTFFTVLLWEVSIKSFLYWITILGALFFLFIPQYVIRDSLMVLAWAPACLLLLYATRTGRRRRTLTIVALLLIAYGFWVRINMLVALMPLVYVVIILLARKPVLLWKKLAITAGVAIVFFIGYYFVTYPIQHARRTYPEYKLKLLDIAGITKLTGENWFPDIIRRYPYFSEDTVLMLYSPGGIDDIYWPDQRKSYFPDPGLDSVYGMTTWSWHRAILHHPFYYLGNRLNGFLYYLRIRQRFKWNEYYNASPFWIQPNGPLPAKHEATPLKDSISNIYIFFFRTPIFYPWVWLLLNILALVGFVRRYRRGTGDLQLYWLTHVCIQLSGILFVFSQVLIYQTDRDFRFTFWNVICAFIALIGWFSQPPLSIPDNDQKEGRPLKFRMLISLKR